MPRVDIRQQTRLLVVDPHEECGEPVVCRHAMQRPVNTDHQLSEGRFDEWDVASQQALDVGHQEGRGNPLSANVPNQDGELRWPERDEVKEVAGQMVGGLAASKGGQGPQGMGGVRRRND